MGKKKKKKTTASSSRIHGLVINEYMKCYELHWEFKNENGLIRHIAAPIEAHAEEMMKKT